MDGGRAGHEIVGTIECRIFSVGENPIDIVGLPEPSRFFKHGGPRLHGIDLSEVLRQASGNLDVTGPEVERPLATREPLEERTIDAGRVVRAVDIGARNVGIRKTFAAEVAPPLDGLAILVYENVSGLGLGGPAAGRSSGTPIQSSPIFLFESYTSGTPIPWHGYCESR